MSDITEPPIYESTTRRQRVMIHLTMLPGVLLVILSVVALWIQIDFGLRTSISQIITYEPAPKETFWLSIPVLPTFIVGFTFFIVWFWRLLGMHELFPIRAEVPTTNS